MPLDVFEAFERDAGHIQRLARNEGESPSEKFDRMARDRLQGSTSCYWWSDE